MTHFYKIILSIFIMFIHFSPLSPLFSMDSETEKLQVSFNLPPHMLEELQKTLSDFPIDQLKISSPPSKSMARVLSLDGGGTRGYMSCLFLCYLTRLTNKPIHELFDLIITTSTGTFMGAAFGTKKKEICPKPKFNIPTNDIYIPIRDIFERKAPESDYYTPDDMLHVYEENSKEIFTKKSVFDPGATYEDSYLIKHLKKYFGEGRLSELKMSIYITAHNMQEGKFIIFSKHSALSDPSEDIPVWMAIRGAVAAPTYFDAYEINGKSISDGGIDFNNPAPFGIIKATQEFKTPWDKILVLSIGTGKPDMIKPHEKYSTLGLIHWPSDLITRLFTGTKSEVLMEEIYKIHHASPEDIAKHYFRICPTLPEKLYTTDNTTESYFRDLEKIAYEILHKHKRDFAQFGSQLVTQNFQAPSLPVLQTPVIPPRNPDNLLVTTQNGKKKSEGRSRAYSL